jgi:fluoride exporter
MSDPETANGLIRVSTVPGRIVPPDAGHEVEAAPEPHADPPLLAPEAVAEAELAHTPQDMRLLPPHPAWREWLPTIAAVSAGGYLGANARYLVGLWAAEHFGTAFPYGTLLINVSGSFVLGFYLTLVTERFSSRPTTRLFLATGFLGAYTTFSTLSYEAVQLVVEGMALVGVAYVGASLLLGIAAAVAGILAANAL